jgi:uncharacterized membrane protein
MDIDRTISAIIMIILIIGSLGIVYMILNPTNGDDFTEFYLLGEDGKANDYPTNLSINQKGNLTVGVVNHEHYTSSYQMKIMQDSTIMKTENFTLENDKKAEIPFEFKFSSAGQYKIEFNLYKLPDTKNVYRSLYLIVNVK